MPGLVFGQVGGTPQAGIVLLLASPGWAREGSPLTIYVVVICRICASFNVLAIYLILMQESMDHIDEILYNREIWLDQERRDRVEEQITIR